MNCNHCGAMRRAEGGIKIGGRALPTVLPNCPCAGLFRVAEDDGEYEINGLSVPVISTAVAEYSTGWRMCTTDPREVTPEILEVTCDNYELDDLFLWTVEIFAVPRSVGQDCNYFGSPVVAQSRLTNFGRSSQSYTPLLAPNGGTIFWYHVWLYSFGGPVFTVDPIVNVKYRFARTP